MQERVLIVDDDELILRALARILEVNGYLTRCYLSPEEALAKLEAEAPVVIISDYMMPGMDGIDFLKRARQVSPGAVRILCTAAEDFKMALQAVNTGEVFRIIAKPWHQQELLATVSQAAESARLRTENERLTAEVQRQNLQLEAELGKRKEINLRLEEMVRHRTQALLEGLIAALDYRDSETQWHSRRVSLYARRLAQQLAIAEPELTVIEHGALLHDIGKIGIRDEVLLKPGPLDKDEWITMKRHPELGWKLLQRVDYLRPAADIVLQHQEKFDGGGYPAGLSGEGIVIGARIFHVVDTLDAITSDRPYRKARPFADARAELLRCRGTQFDPRVVDAFVAVPPEEWERIRTDVETVAVLAADLQEPAPIPEHEDRAQAPATMPPPAAPSSPPEPPPSPSPG